MEREKGLNLGSPVTDEEREIFEKAVGQYQLNLRLDFVVPHERMGIVVRTTASYADVDVSHCETMQDFQMQLEVSQKWFNRHQLIITKVFLHDHMSSKEGDANDL